MKTFIKLYNFMMNPVRNEKGAQSLEWLGLAALLILVLSLVSTAVSSGGTQITGIINSILSKISAMVGS